MRDHQPRSGSLRTAATYDSGRRVGDDRPTTLSFVVATVAVAVSAFLGLGQAAASAGVAASFQVLDDRSASNPVDLDPARPVVGVDTTSSRSEYLLEALTRLERSPDPIDAPASVSDPATITIQGGTPTSTPTPSPPSTLTTSPTTTTTSRATPTTVVETSHDTTMAIQEWQPISTAAFRRFVEARGLSTTDWLTPGLVHGTIVQQDQSINVVLVHRSATAPMRVSPGDRGSQRVGVWAQEIGGSAGINANWYDPFDGPAVSDGRVYGGSDHGYTALFGFTAGGDLVADHHHKIHGQVDPRVVEAVSGHPTLVHRGTPTTDFGNDQTFLDRNPRSAIGVSAGADVLILVTVDGRRRGAIGMTGAETTRLMQRLGADDAVMLDGGGSSAMWIAGKGIVNRQSEPGRAVGNQIAVFGS